MMWRYNLMVSLLRALHITRYSSTHSVFVYDIAKHIDAWVEDVAEPIGFYFYDPASEEEQAEQEDPSSADDDEPPPVDWAQSLFEPHDDEDRSLPSPENPEELYNYLT